MQISAQRRKHKGKLVPGCAIAFDSSAPTGGDKDLGTPNKQYGGPGVGSGGATNDTALGMLLIIAEDLVDQDGDGYVDDPDDNAKGGVISVALETPACLETLGLLDIESSEAATLEVFGADGVLLGTYGASGLGNNSFEELTHRSVRGRLLRALPHRLRSHHPLRPLHGRRAGAGLLERRGLR